MTTTRIAATPRLARRRARAAIALAWLGAGLPTLLLTPLPLYDRLLGWSAAFWLVGAPLALLAALAPRLPLALLRAARPRPRGCAFAR
ncbi:hypothetical protein MBSD_n0101 [Mizugakiibacter sediminis]|uniref:Uncharacterized protein n=1 Tax=Mizugakiibacter sediminis TaxID=1475481 RepID=A0A0K8QJ15_9GAMM|nr:hypothetical protein [Mizugakiibacter sediminis]GAP64819.1 hypothetical protein MBSD_n0101 [Mizugakiibacter sediminis]